MTNTEFEFTLRQSARLTESGLPGVIVGRAETLDGGRSYLFRHKDAHGDQIEAWWGASAICEDTDPETNKRRRWPTLTTGTPPAVLPLGQDVTLVDSAQTGVLVARSETVDDGWRYQIRYTTAAGDQVEPWLGASAITAAP